MDRLSDREIAKQVGCSQQYVARMKGDVTTSGNVSLPTTRTDSLGRVQPTSKPHKPAPTPEPQEERPHVVAAPGSTVNKFMREPEPENY